MKPKTFVTLKPLSNRAAEKAAKRVRAAIAPSEHQSQSMLFQWAALNVIHLPELMLLFAIPNFAGHHGSEEARLRSGARAKREGRKAGVPDICLPVSRGPYHSLFIEMKKPSKEPTSGQSAWHAMLREHGHSVRVCHSVDEARDAITGYLKLPKLFVASGIEGVLALVLCDEASGDSWTFRKDETHANSTRIDMRMGGILAGMSRKNPELFATLRRALWDKP